MFRNRWWVRGLQEPLEVGTIEVYPKGVIVETGLW